MRYLGVDFGVKKIGLAISYNGFLAQEYDTLFDVVEPIEEIKKICQQEQIEKIILGLPVNADQGQSPMAVRIRQFAQVLEKRLGLPVALEDETLTSVWAQEMLKTEGCDIEQAKKRVDQFCAKLILQQHLENKSSIQ